MGLRHRGPGRVRPFFLILGVAVATSAVWQPAAAIQEGTATAREGFQGEAGGYANLDLRGGRGRPTPAQEAAAAELGAVVRWNDLGTPQSVIDPDGSLGAGLPADPVAAARSWLRDNRTLFRLSSTDVAEMELLGSNPIGSGHAVILRQRFDGLDAGRDGLVVVAVARGRVVYVSSTLAGDEAVTGSARISAEQALVAAAGNVGRGIRLGDVSRVGAEGGWTLMRVAGFGAPQRARLVAVPTPDAGVRPAFETLLLGDSFGFTHFVDAETGEILIRQDLVDYAIDNPKWEVFPAYPPLDYSTTDTRVIWCGITADPECERVVDDPASPFPWDVDVVAGTPTFQTRGNSARSTEKWNSPTPGGSDQGVNFSSSPTRDYVYPWTNQWFEDACDPAVFASPEQNDIDAARANLFAMHNRMHDWAYRLGFTETTWNAQVHNFGRGEDENDPEHGNAQAGGISGGFPNFNGRDNANQFTPNDGISPTTNMFLWQPIPAAFYAPCVDGDYDMSVIGHEYTHMISNRMVAGPDARLVGLQANAMGESWSDYTGMEYMFEYGFIPPDQTNPFAVGAYVTSDDVAGIRNYGMNRSPLNYGDVGYDFVCTTNAMGQCVILGQVHADGEIWSATLFDLRQAMNDRYGSGSAATQAQCADGVLPIGSCPGNRRLIQLVFDAWLLMPGPATMLDARDAMLAADLTRFGGANQDLLWNGFARRGFGEKATSRNSDTVDPVPDFTSPHATEATVTFKTVGDGTGAPAELYVGQYEARVTPIADSDPATRRRDTFQIVPGTYDFVARADGFGTTRVRARFMAGQVQDLPVSLTRNLASSANGATASGDGINLDKLIDDTEATNWAFLGSDPAMENEAIGTQVTVQLDPSLPEHEFRRIQVSAMLRPRMHTDPGGDTGTQNRFSALRQFEILICTAVGSVDCTQDDQFTSIFVSPEDAFPAIAPRPRAPDLITRSFLVPQSVATHVRIAVLDNQCTGGPDFQGEQDNDPQFMTDCGDGSGQDDIVRIAELQVFRR